MNCSLCKSPKVSEFAITRVGKQYFQCKICYLVFLNPKQQMGFFEEKARYQTHNNDIRQSGYRRFLNQMWEPLKTIISRPCQILDFGCGPTDAFARLAAEDGYDVQSYDPYFYNNENLLRQQYDVVWCSEVFEHFNRPSESVELVFSLMKPRGLVAIMTDPYPDDPEDFKAWGYHNDPTHISFYSEQTMRWIAENNSPKLHVAQASKRVTFFTVPEA